MQSNFFSPFFFPPSQIFSEKLNFVHLRTLQKQSGQTGSWHRGVNTANQPEKNEMEKLSQKATQAIIWCRLRVQWKMFGTYTTRAANTSVQTVEVKVRKSHCFTQKLLLWKTRSTHFINLHIIKLFFSIWSILQLNFMLKRKKKKPKLCKRSK